MKRTAVAAILALAALWPLAHRALVARYAIGPWKLGGLAMYATPSLPPLVAVVVSGPEGPTVLDEATLPEPLRARLDRFRVERHALGTLRDPEAEARAILRARRDLDGVAIVVQRSVLDPGSARMTRSTERYLYVAEARDRE